jgi:alkanesulfonate monooxygenase SsuD/methylene tetrahydromethanopterin reductase-like flavin-dependent oxidoreductase (luciferase family)
MQQPHPPILVGGGGPRLLKLAAREADIVGIHARLDPAGIDPGAANDLGPDAVAEKVGWVRSELERIGRPAAEVELQFSVYLARIQDSPRAASATRSSFGAALGADPRLVDESPAVLVGSVERCVELLRERRERFGLSYWHLGHDVDAAARIVSRLSGT